MAYANNQRPGFPAPKVEEETMPRPRKWRKVCCLPERDLFGPLNKSGPQEEPVIMTVEEYETIRLIDLEGLNQEECAERMRVARATVQKIYVEARKKIARALVEGIPLKIQGGDYKLYEEGEGEYGCQRCRRGRCHGEEGHGRPGMLHGGKGEQR